MDDNPRIALGIEDAEDGDIHGVITFVSFVRREMGAIIVADELPGAVADRLRAVSRDVERLQEFLEGYAAACSFQSADPEESE